MSVYLCLFIYLFLLIFYLESGRYADWPRDKGAQRVSHARVEKFRHNLNFLFVKPLKAA